jgi:hypothetical protein
MTLSKGTRDAIDCAIQRLRTLFEEEFTQQATGRFGLHTDRRAVPGVADDVRSLDTPVAVVRPWVEPVEALSLTPTQIIQRSELVGAIVYLRREGLDGGEAVARLIREAAFTATNQLLAVRVAETIKVLPEVTAKGRQSSGYRDIVRDLFPLLAQEDDEGFGSTSRSVVTSSERPCRCYSIAVFPQRPLSPAERVSTMPSGSSTIQE